jgi:hypothetical protein
MAEHRRDEAFTLEQLISTLEHIEVSELASDLRANVRAELKRMKRNISAILRFIAYAAAQPAAQTLELHNAILEVRRECLAINGAISRLLILQALWPNPERWTAYTERAAAQYAQMAQAMRAMCLIAAPGQSQALAEAL